MRCEFLDIDDERWRRALESVRSSIYQWPSYLRTADRFENGELRIAFLHEGDDFFGVPLLLRRLPSTISSEPGWRDAITPYGYASPISSASSENRLRRFWEALPNFLAGEGIVSAFFRFHPLLSTDYPLKALSELGQVVTHGRTVCINLELTGEELWRQVRSRYRSNINSLRRQGFECQMDQWNRYDDFIMIYLDTMSRVNAESFYFFHREYFYQLRENLADALHFAVVLSPDRKLAAGGLFTERNGLYDYHLGGAANAFLKFSPMKLLLHDVSIWAKDGGATDFHLGGGVRGREDSLFKFKAGFSKGRANFSTFRLICGTEVYWALEKRWRTRCGVGDDYAESFFPVYRAPCPLA